MKKYIIGFLIGLFVCGVIGVSAATYLYHSDEVSYTPSNSDWKVNNVNAALNDLYSKVNNNSKKDITQLIGSYNSITSNIDVSSFNDANVDHYLAVPMFDGEQSARVYGDPNGTWQSYVYAYYVKPIISISDNKLTITPAAIRAKSHYDNSSYIITNLYYIGNKTSSSYNSVTSNIDISSFNDTNINHYIAVPSDNGEQSSRTYADINGNWQGMGYAYFTKPTMSISNDKLTITPAMIRAKSQYDNSSYINTKLYYVGPIMQ